LNDSRRVILECPARVRLVEGEPGVGKTWFGCELAQYESTHPALGVQSPATILFLTFARNAVARIRQVLTTTSPSSEAKTHHSAKRMRIDTFCGFSWWLVESYGCYTMGGTRRRPWLIGSREVADAPIPSGYEGYTFDTVEEKARTLLRIEAVGKLISEMYPLIIVDEFQDVDGRLFELIALLGGKSRLVLL